MTDKIVDFVEPLQSPGNFQFVGNTSSCCPVWIVTKFWKDNVSQTRKVYLYFWVEGNFLALIIYVYSFVAQICLENSSVFSKSMSHLPSTFLLLSEIMIKHGM